MRQSHGLDITGWNTVLLEWFFPTEGPRPAFLYSSAAELQRINISHDLGLHDPAGDLVHAARLYERWPVVNSYTWSRQGALAADPPPFLTHLAVSVLVVDEQIDKGSNAFYDPLSQRLSRRSRISLEEYRASFHVWWALLANWLDNDLRGERGTATWRKIPRSGPRSLIGHPYTQVIFNRHDRGVLDDFLEMVFDASADVLGVDDEDAAARHLFGEFAQWAKHAKGISPRLFAVATSSRKGDHDSLGYLLLDRLAEAASDTTTVTESTLGLRVVPTLDEWERRLHLSIIAPSSASADSLIRVEPEGMPALELNEPGAPIHLAVAISNHALSAGWSIPSRSGKDLFLRPADEFVLVRRDWDEWVTVKDAGPGEDVYVLTTPDRQRQLSEQFDGLSERRFDGVPAGWIVLGPGQLRQQSDAPPAVAPRLVGGLPLRTKGHSYLVGGAPTLEVPLTISEVVVSGQRATPTNGRLEISALGLEAGQHRVTCGPFAADLWLIDTATIPVGQPKVGLTAACEIRQVGPGLQLVSGLGPIPRQHQVTGLCLCPPSTTTTLLGAPNVCAAVTPQLSSWAMKLGLSSNVFEPQVYSSYGPAGRPFGVPWWIVGNLDENPWIASMPGFGQDEETALPDRELWLAVMERTGESPRIILNGEQREPDVRSQWAAYRRDGLES